MPFQAKFGRLFDVHVAFRPKGPDELFERIVAVVPPERRHRAMDLAVGWGDSIKSLLSHFQELIAVEPDPLVADQLRLNHPRGILQITSVEQCTQEAASVDLVTVAAPLYGADLAQVMDNVLRCLGPAGILAIWARGIPRTPTAVTSITAQEFADRWNRFRDPRLDPAESPDHARRAAKRFTILEERLVPHILWLSPHEFVGFWRTTSYASAYARELAVPDAYWRDLESRYSLAWPRTKIPVDFSPWLLLARKE